VQGTAPGADPGCSEAQPRGRHGHGRECSRTDNGTGEEERLERVHVGWRERCEVEEEAARRVSGIEEGAAFVLERWRCVVFARSQAELRARRAVRWINCQVKKRGVI